MFSKAKRTHAEQFQNSGKAISEKVRLYSQLGRALLAAKESGAEPYAAALAEVVNAQSRQPFAARWGHGATPNTLSVLFIPFRELTCGSWLPHHQHDDDDQE